MTDPTEKDIDLKDYTLQIVRDSGLEELIQDISYRKDSRNWSNYYGFRRTI